MQPFNPDAKCTKCGSGNAASRWFAPAYYTRILGFKVEVPVPGNGIYDEEYIVRTCKTCDYRWAEAPLDKKELNHDRSA